MSYTGVGRNLCWGAWQPRRRKRQDRDAEGVEGKGIGSLAERRKLPQRGLGRSHGRKRVLAYLEFEKNTTDSHKSVTFDISAAYI